MRETEGAAIVMRRYGGPEVLHVERVRLPALLSGEIRVRAIASAVNHADLEIRMGNWPILRPEPFPYVPGLEVTGEVVDIGPDVADFRIGDRITSMMQGLGGVRARRPGGYAEYVTVDADAAASIGQRADPLGMAALGLAGVTAFEGLRRLGDLEGRRILVTGAAGGVGSAAVAIAKAQGAQVVGLLSSPKQDEYVRSLGASETHTSADAAAGGLGSESLDGVLDTVAGAAFGAYVSALRPGSTLSLVGAVGGSAVTFNAYRLLEVTLTGYSSENLDGHALRRAIGRISQWLIEGALRPPAVTSFPLSDAAAAHTALERHEIRGRALLVPR